MERLSKINFHPKVREDMDRLDGSVRKYIFKALERIQQNPSIGKQLGHRSGRNLTGLFSVKLKKLGVRIVYERKSESNIVALVIAIGPRERHRVYENAARRKRSE